MDNAIRVLLVEDNPGDARLIREMLLGSGSGEFTLTAVGALQAVLEQNRETSYDVILLDLSLPDSSGTDTLLKVRSEISDTALIVLTGFNDQRVGAQAVQMGAQDYLIKDDVDAKLLHHAIRYAIERHRVEARLRHSEEAYRSLIDDVFDTSMVSVIILDKTFVVVWCNAATEVYFGIGRDEFMGKDKRILINDKLKCVFADPDDYATRMLAAYEKQDFTDRFECHVVPGANRAERWLEHWSQPIRTGMYANGRIEYYTDITARKTLEFAEQEQHRFTEALYDTAAILTSTLDLDEVLDRILANIGVVVPHDTASITLNNVGGLQIARRRSDTKRDTQEIAAENQLQLEDIPLLRRSANTREGIIVPDLQREKQFAEVAAQANVRAYAGVPIHLQKEIIGFINVFNRKVNAFSEDDIARLTAFAQQCAIAIQNARLYRQSQELAAWEERQRLARELHDSVSQTLFTCSAMCESALRRWEKNPPRARELMTEVHRLTVTALSEMRTLLLELRPEALTKVSLKQLFEQYLQPIQTRRGFKLLMDIDDGPPLPPDVQIAFYRITQEALNNIDKHAKATLVHVTAHHYPDRLELTIKDNGTGFEVHRVEPTSLGLGIMRERAAAIDASLHVESQVGEGTQITLVWMKQRGLKA
jgi:signal transduction histidine kinase/CheY-like chemotaxis protein